MKRRVVKMAGRNLVVIVLAALLVVCGISEVAFCAQETKQAQENKVVKFFKDVFNWPFSVTKQGAETVGRTTKSGVMTVTDTGTSAVQTVTGKPEKIKDVVVDPIKGTAETGYTAVKGSLNTPVEGTKEAFE
jgi:uncharacterized protein YunC (DUF1805 family)